MKYNRSLNYPVPVQDTWDIQDSSKVMCMQECPRKYFYNYVLGWQIAQPSIHLIFGSAWHEAMAHLLETDYSKENVHIAFEKLTTYYRQYISVDEEEMYLPKVPNRAFYALIGYVHQWDGDDRNVQVVEHNGTKMIEIGGLITLNLDHDLAFKMDSILKDHSGIFSREHKTASSSWNWADQWQLSTQVGTYHFVLENLYPPEEISGIQMNCTVFKKTKSDAKKDDVDPFRHFEYLRHKIYKDPDQMQNWYVNMIWWLDFIKQNFDHLGECTDRDNVLFAFPMNTKSCGNWAGCEYRDFCVSWANPLRHIDRLPIGWERRFWNPLDSEEIKVKVDLKGGD